MNILERFKTIMSSNINALLDKAENPAKMVDQLLRDLTDDLNKVRAETAGVMAEETRAKRALDEMTQQTEKMQNYAERAVAAGNDDDARRFLTEKSACAAKLAGLEQAYALAAANAAKMREMHDKLTAQIGELGARRDTIRAKVAAAKTQEHVNQMGESLGSVQGSLDSFSAMEAKADRMLDEANARAALAGAGQDTIDDLTGKYDSAPAGVDDELAALKAKLGK